MSLERRLPADSRQLRVERWLDDSRQALPNPDAGRVLGPLFADLGGVAQPDDGRGRHNWVWQALLLAPWWSRSSVRPH